MFGHLDDPAGVFPGEPELASVLWRARGIRVRRRLGVVAAGLIVIAGVAGFLLHAADGGRLPVDRDGLPVQCPGGTSDRGNAGAHDRAGERGLRRRPRRIRPGGTPRARGPGRVDGRRQHVERAERRPAARLRAGQRVLRSVRVRGSRRVSVGRGHPDGRRRAPVGHRRQRRHLASGTRSDPWSTTSVPSTANVWALTSSCGATTDGRSATAPCALALEQSLDDGAHVECPGERGGHGVTRGRTNAEHVELARITLNRAYVLTDTASCLPGAEMVLEYTADGGRSWSTRPVPCTAPAVLGAEVAASGTDDLWFLCGSQASAGSQSKALYRSGDGGYTWYLAASATGLGTPAPPASEPNSATPRRLRRPLLHRPQEPGGGQSHHGVALPDEGHAVRDGVRWPLVGHGAGTRHGRVRQWITGERDLRQRHAGMDLRVRRRPVAHR